MQADDIFKDLGFKKLEWADYKGNIHTVSYSKSNKRIVIFAQEPTLLKVENRVEKVKPTEKEDEAIKLKIKELQDAKNHNSTTLQK